MTLKRRVWHINLCVSVVLRKDAAGVSVVFRKDAAGVSVVLREGATCASVVLREGATDWFVVRGWSGSPAARILVLLIHLLLLIHKCNYNYVQEKRCIVGAAM